MKSKNWKISLTYAGIMGILTIFLCLAVSDGMIGLNQPPAGNHIGVIPFWVGLVALPLIFHKWVKWRYTLINFPLYVLLYFPVYRIFDLKHTHYFLETGGFISFPIFWGAILVAVMFWGVQSLVYLIVNIISYAIQKRKTKD